MTKCVVAVLLALVLVCGVAFADENNASADEDQLSFAVSFGYYLPSDSATKSVFGDAWPQLGVRWYERKKPDKWCRSWNLTGVLRNNDGDAKLFPLTYGMERGIGNSNSSTQPYVALRAGPYYGKVDVDAMGVHESRIGLNANASVGIVVEKNFFLEARYDYFSRIADFDLDGFSIAAGVRLFDM